MIVAYGMPVPPRQRQILDLQDARDEQTTPRHPEPPGTAPTAGTAPRPTSPAYCSRRDRSARRPDPARHRGTPRAGGSPYGPNRPTGGKPAAALFVMCGPRCPSGPVAPELPQATKSGDRHLVGGGLPQRLALCVATVQVQPPQRVGPEPAEPLGHRPAGRRPSTLQVRPRTASTTTGTPLASDSASTSSVMSDFAISGVFAVPHWLAIRSATRSTSAASRSRAARFADPLDQQRAQLVQPVAADRGGRNDGRVLQTVRLHQPVRSARQLLRCSSVSLSRGSARRPSPRSATRTA